MASSRSRRPTDSYEPSSEAAPASDEAAPGPSSSSPSPSSTSDPSSSGDGSQLARELDQIRRLSAELERQLERVLARQRELESLSTETNAELLVLLTALRPLREAFAEPPGPAPIDEYIEDMIDPEFGLRPARTIIMASAEKILHGYDALRFPLPARAPASEPDED